MFSANIWTLATCTEKSPVFSRGKRGFPAAPTSKCTFAAETFSDLNGILQSIIETNNFSAVESSGIIQSYASKYRSGNECDEQMKRILVNCKDIIDLRRNGKTQELEDKLRLLQLNLDSVDRSASQKESNMRRLFEDVQKKLELELRQSQFERLLIEKNREESVIKLTVLHLESGDVKSACKEFEGLKNRVSLAEKMVQSAYLNSKVKLQDLATFVCQINFYLTSLLAISALYTEMEKKKQLDEKETIILFYELQYTLVNDSKFATLPSGKKFLDLKMKLLPHKAAIMTSLVNDIKKGEFERPNKVVECAKSTWRCERLFVPDLMQLYLASANLNNFALLYHFVRQLTSINNTCEAYVAIWPQLRANGTGDTIEALAVWSHASEILKMENVSGKSCNEIAKSKPPSYMHNLISTENIYTKYGLSNNMKYQPKNYHMVYFFADFISTQPNYKMQNKYFNKIIDTINDLPSTFDKCYAMSAVYKKLKNLGMLENFEYFQVLSTLKRIKTRSTLNAYSKSKCESAAVDTPKIFHKLLYEGTSNCRLLNRFYSHSALYCASWFYQQFGYRKIYAWEYESADDKTSTRWDLRMSNENHGFNLHSKDQPNYYLRYIYDDVRGSEEKYDVHYDFFRIHIKDIDYIVLEPTSSKYVCGL